MTNPLHFDHLGFIGAAYGLFFTVTAWLALGAQMRLGRVARRLRAVDPRAARSGLGAQDRGS